MSGYKTNRQTNGLQVKVIETEDGDSAMLDVYSDPFLSQQELQDVVDTLQDVADGME